MNKGIQIGVGFDMALNIILDELANDPAYIAEIDNISIKYLGEKEDIANDKMQIFEIVRRIK